MILGIFIGLAIYGLVDLISELRNPPVRVTKVYMRSGYLIYTEIADFERTYIVYPN